MKKSVKNRKNPSALSPFGLNPEEWRLLAEPQTHSPIVIFENKKDRGFQLIGRWEPSNQKSPLQSLQLLSI